MHIKNFTVRDEKACVDWGPGGWLGSVMGGAAPPHLPEFYPVSDMRLLVGQVTKEDPVCTKLCEPVFEKSYRTWVNQTIIGASATVATRAVPVY